MAVSSYPDKLFKYAREKAGSEELPFLLDHLDAYVSGIKEASMASKIQLGREMGIQELLLRSHEAYRGIQDILNERGWKLQQDAKTWTPP